MVQGKPGFCLAMANTPHPTPVTTTPGPKSQILTQNPSLEPRLACPEHDRKPQSKPNRSRLKGTQVKGSNEAEELTRGPKQTPRLLGPRNSRRAYWESGQKNQLLRVTVHYGAIECIVCCSLFDYSLKYVNIVGKAMSMQCLEKLFPNTCRA